MSIKRCSISACSVQRRRQFQPNFSMCRICTRLPPATCMHVAFGLLCASCFSETNFGLSTILTHGSCLSLATILFNLQPCPLCRNIGPYIGPYREHSSVFNVQRSTSAAAACHISQPIQPICKQTKYEASFSLHNHTFWLLRQIARFAIEEITSVRWTVREKTEWCGTPQLRNTGACSYLVCPNAVTCQRERFSLLRYSVRTRSRQLYIRSPRREDLAFKRTRWG